jgi:hypothetical protein
VSIWKNRNGKTIRRTQIGGQFAPRLIDMLRSPAWRVLSLSARRILDRLEIELADHGGTDNGKLPVAYEDFVRYGIERHAAAAAIRETVALGFVRVTEAGRGGNAEFRKPNLFGLTYRPSEVGPTDEWKRITEDDAQTIARAARSTPGRQKQKAGVGKYRISVRETHTENVQTPVRETHTTVPVRKTHTTLDIWGGGPRPASVPIRKGRPMNGKGEHRRQAAMASAPRWEIGNRERRK